MKITQISVTSGRVLNLGNYNTARVEFSATADLEPDEDPDEAFRELWSKVDKKTEAKAEGWRP